MKNSLHLRYKNYFSRRTYHRSSKHEIFSENVYITNVITRDLLVSLNSKRHNININSTCTFDRINSKPVDPFEHGKTREFARCWKESKNWNIPGTTNFPISAKEVIDSSRRGRGSNAVLFFYRCTHNCNILQSRVIYDPIQPVRPSWIINLTFPIGLPSPNINIILPVFFCLTSTSF